jgi:hypothetical protein
MLGDRPIRISSSIATRPRGRPALRRVGRTLVLVAYLGFAANVLSAVIVQLEHALGAATASDIRAGLPNYQGIDWADTHFREFLELEEVHHSYVGWRRLPYQGATINIDQDGMRRTYVDPATHRPGPSRSSAPRRFGGRAPTTSTRFRRPLPGCVRRTARSISARRRTPRIRI